MLIDDVKVELKAGRGGDGVVSFKKAKMELGPGGGSGGRGGSIYVKGISDIGALKRFRYQKNIKAYDGKKGLSEERDGADGESLYLNVPVGTIIYNFDTGEKIAEVNKIGEEVLIAKGGKGGRGNFKFRSSVNTSPEEFEYGKEGESFLARFELKLIADIGFVGLPNIGKSSLLNELTKAKTKVANYPFTTLEPSLGVYYDLILADIPGLIEGASKGKGLGIKFLRHIERTRVIFHFIAADSSSPSKDYETVREELENHKKTLLDKPEYIIISRKDEVSQEKLSKVEESLKKYNDKIYKVSILEEESLKKIKKLLNKLTEEKKVNQLRT